MTKKQRNQIRNIVGIHPFRTLFKLTCRTCEVQTTTYLIGPAIRFLLEHEDHDTELNISQEKKEGSDT